MNPFYTAGGFEVHDIIENGINYWFVVDVRPRPKQWVARFPYGPDGFANAKYFADCKAAQ